MKILLVEPNFPIPRKSKNHKHFLPIGLLKIASYLRERNIQVRIIRGLSDTTFEVSELKHFNPNEIWVTSLFTYWAEYVRDAVQYYKSMFPNAKAVVGGIYASLFLDDEVRQYTGCDEVHQGIIPEAEKCFPAYDLIENSNPHSIDYQIIHTSRGCERKCPFCGTWKIEPKFIAERSIKAQIRFRKLVFYDNNLLMNPYIEEILEELAELKKKGRILWCESQSGFDGRILLEKPYLASLLKKAGFRCPRIAWDWKYKDNLKIKKQLDTLIEAGYQSRDIYIFMLYNWDIQFEKMELKRIKCWDWKVQIADCRYRPLNQLFDHYNARQAGQTSEHYFIHENWSDALVKQFRKNVRHQNICVRQQVPFYSKSFEHLRVDKEIVRKVKQIHKVEEQKKLLEAQGIDYWVPGHIRNPVQV